MFGLMRSPADQIRIEELEVFARVGVPDEERATPQRLVICATLEPRRPFEELGDEIGQAVDYAAVCEEIARCAAERADRLIETLAEALVNRLLARFALVRVELEVRKFILPQTKFVAVRIVRAAT